MVGIVVVSHSKPLADAAVELSLQMVSGEPPPIEVAAGNDGRLGTDAAAVAAAIQRADRRGGGSGVLVITDLGSALLSADMALELVDDLAGEVLLSRAPFVEGLVAAVVQAAIGKSLADVEQEAVGAGTAKVTQLESGDTPGSDAESPVDSDGARGRSDVRATGQASVDVTIVNPLGIHARPAALLAKTAGDLDVDVAITNLDTGAGPAAADSMLELMTIGARQGATVRLSATGPGAQSAVDAVAAVIRDGLGEAAD